jgi:soluble lytic murein transglycosylase
MRHWLPWVLVGTVLVFVLLTALWVQRTQPRRDGRFDREIQQAAGRYGVDPALVKAVIWRESAFDAKARGRSGEIGLMQIQELAAVDWSTSQGVIGFEMEHLENPTTNVLAGTWYLGHLLKRYRHTDNPVPYALADYNAGRANVRKWITAEGADTNSAVFVEQIAFPSTRKYVQAVTARRSRYQRD